MSKSNRGVRTIRKALRNRRLVRTADPGWIGGALVSAHCGHPLPARARHLGRSAMDLGVRRESEHGNLMLYASCKDVGEGEPRCQIRYLVARTSVAHTLERACVRRLDAP